MNTIPHSRELRRTFYDDVSSSVVDAIAAGVKRGKIHISIPETNTAQDVYRVGTVLELAREIVCAIAQDGKRVRVCVQGSMGVGVFQGLPLQLSGLRRLLEKMDWPEAVEPFVTFGAVGADEVDAGDDVFLLLGPQNIVGESFAPPPATWTDTPMHTHTDTRRGK